MATNPKSCLAVVVDPSRHGRFQARDVDRSNGQPQHLLQTAGHDQTPLRARGIAVEPDGTRLLAQVVGRRRSVTVLPDAEYQPPTDLVVITARS